MGVHSTLFGPVKYAILPQHLKSEELIGGNGLVEMGTFVAILLGTIAGGLIIAIEGSGPVVAGAVVLGIAVAGYVVSRAIPHTPAVDPGLAINWNPVSETWRNLRFAQQNRVVSCRCSASRGSGSTARRSSRNSRVLRRPCSAATSTSSTFLLALFSLASGIGSLLCERMSGRRVELGLVPFGSIGLTLFAVDLWLASRHLHADALAGLDVFLANPADWRSPRTSC